MYLHKVISQNNEEKKLFFLHPEGRKDVKSSGTNTRLRICTKMSRIHNTEAKACQTLM
jgi:hypothetical protein